MKPTLSHKVRVSPDVLCQEVGDELVLLDLSGERYFGLDDVGARIWALLGEHEDVQSVYDIMLDEYEVEPARLRDDLLEHIGALAEAGLVTLDTDHATAP